MVRELEPRRFRALDPEATAHLDEHGYVAIASAASEAELQTARGLLWEFLEARRVARDGSLLTEGWDRTDPKTWTDRSFGEGHALGTTQHGTIGEMGSACHSDAFWYVRSLPGVLDGFATAYGTHELVSAYDRMSVNRPVTCGEEGIISQPWARGGGGPAELSRHLHTHYKDGLGPEQRICYAILSLWDMGREAGAT